MTEMSSYYLIFDSLRKCRVPGYRTAVNPNCSPTPTFDWWGGGSGCSEAQLQSNSNFWEGVTAIKKLKLNCSHPPPPSEVGLQRQKQNCAVARVSVRSAGWPLVNFMCLIITTTGSYLWSILAAIFVHHN